jgi:hypothetical protein
MVLFRCLPGLTEQRRNTGVVRMQRDPLCGTQAARSQPEPKGDGQGHSRQVGDGTPAEADRIAMQVRHDRHARSGRRRCMATVRRSRSSATVSRASNTGRIMIVSRSTRTYTTRMLASAPTGLRRRNSRAIPLSHKAKIWKTVCVAPLPSVACMAIQIPPSAMITTTGTTSSTQERANHRRVPTIISTVSREFGLAVGTQAESDVGTYG